MGNDTIVMSLGKHDTIVMGDYFDEATRAASGFQQKTWLTGTLDLQGNLSLSEMRVMLQRCGQVQYQCRIGESIGNEMYSIGE